MTDVGGRRLAKVVFAFILLEFAVGLAFAVMLARLPGRSLASALGAGELVFAAGVLLFPILGLVIATRQPHNALGWVMLAIGVVAFEPFTGYAEYALEAQIRKNAAPVDLVPDGVARYAPEVEAAVYFSVLEALQNVAKYAEADHTTVRLGVGDGWLTFAVEDDGRGFDPTSVGYGTGLQGMADRVSALEGELEIRSREGEGTVVSGRIPVARGFVTPSGVAAP